MNKRTNSLMIVWTHACTCMRVCLYVSVCVSLVLVRSRTVCVSGREFRLWSVWRLCLQSGAMPQIFACLCLLRLVSGLVAMQSAPQFLGDAEAVLARSCGAHCLTLLRTKSTLLGQVGGDAHVPRSHALMAAVAAEANRSLEEAFALVAAHGRDVAQRGRSEASLAASGVACSTPAACAIKALGANKCNYARVALQKAYNELNVATHSLGVLVSSLCGCLHSGHVSVCAMRGVPAVCTFPYTVYAKAFAGSAQVWEAVKASTATCILHGDAGLLQ